MGQPCAEYPWGVISSISSCSIRPDSETDVKHIDDRRVVKDLISRDSSQALLSLRVKPDTSIRHY